MFQLAHIALVVIGVVNYHLSLGRAKQFLTVIPCTTLIIIHRPLGNVEDYYILVDKLWQYIKFVSVL